MSVVRLEVTKPQPSAEVVGCLERWLELARSGEIQTIAIVGLTSDKAVSTEIVDAHGGLFTLIGGIAYLQHRVLTENLK